jgi:hypothetical protein
MTTRAARLRKSSGEPDGLRSPPQNGGSTAGPHTNQLHLVKAGNFLRMAHFFHSWVHSYLAS